MQIQEAIKQLEDLIDKDAWPRKEAATLLIAEYKIATKTIAAIGPQLLSEMQQAADWQAVCSHLKSLLRNRKKPGYDALIEEMLQKLDAEQGTAPAKHD